MGKRTQKGFRALSLPNGLDEPSPYAMTLRRIDHLIGQLKRVRREVQQLQSHAHEWDSESYCIHCGADGLA